MQAGQFPKVTAFVEGSMERIFLNDNFHYVDVVSLRNGESWTLDAMCKQVVSNYRVISYPPDFVVVWFDRESSKHSSAVIEEKVKDSLEKEGVDRKRIAVCVPDRMSENIILADEPLISKEFEIEEYKYAGDGENGKKLIKEMLSKVGKNYKETFHGVQLLKKARLGRAAKASPSVSSFYNSLNLKCWWK